MMTASCYFCRSVIRAPPLKSRSAVRCQSAAPPGASDATSTSKLVLEVKERLAREHLGLPTGRNGRDDDDMVLWFLKERKFSVDEAVSKLTKAIKWCEEFGVSELSEESVKGLYHTGKAYVHDSLDVYGRPVLVVVAAKHFPSTHDPVENQKLCAYLVEKAVSRLPSGAETILGIFDLRGFQVENGDLQFLKFLIDVFYYYYPKRLGQVLFVDAPFVFQPMWQVVKPLLRSYASLARFCDAETVRKEYFVEETVPPAREQQSQNPREKRGKMMTASCYFCRSVVHAPPLKSRSAVRCRSAAPPGASGATSTSKLVLEVKERLAREHPGLPTGRNGRDDDDMVLWFLKDRKFSVDEAVSKLTKAIKWREEFGVSELSEESVKGLYQTGKAYVHDSLDVYGRPVLVVVAAKHFPSTQDPVENQKLCAYLVEKAVSRLPSGAENILGIFDLRGFRVENGDLQFLKFLIDVFYYYYPKRLGQVLFVDAPFVFQPMWQLVKPLLKSYASLVRFCDAETVRKEYFVEGTVPPDFRN